jgi:hypothetical protein
MGIAGSPLAALRLLEGACHIHRPLLQCLLRGGVSGMRGAEILPTCELLVEGVLPGDFHRAPDGLPVKLSERHFPGNRKKTLAA